MNKKANPFSLSLIYHQQSDFGMDRLADIADRIDAKARYSMNKISAVIKAPSSSKFIKIKSIELPNLFPAGE